MMRRGGWDPTTLFIIMLVLFVGPSLVGGGHRIPSGPVILATLISAVIAITIHEFMHAWTAWKLGDDTAYRLGRVTLNPASHFDPLGFIGFALIALGYTAFAWGRPVPVNSSRFRGSLRQRKLGDALVAFAGPLSNIVQAAAATATIRLAEHSGTDLGDLGFYLSRYAYLNMLLAAFNMVPIPPLDGFVILSALVPNFWYPILAAMRAQGFFLLFALIFVDRFLNGGIVSAMYAPGFNLLSDWLINDTFVHYFFLFT
ncbi:MAG TPA: site-2 protease family protein [Thermomicrobiales bacterium]|nr:site-2 protease family protein [Thermomicrobiales bacterium]